jgi:tRNA(Ile)-lysidine synthase
MLKAFTASIEKKKLFAKTDRILLTVSGGVDSVMMCSLFQQAGYQFAIAHCNFQLRGEESDEDESFVEQLAEKYGVKFHSASFDTSAFAKKNKLSIQAAARQLRYDWFEEIRKQFGYAYIATAHHSDDSVETFLINLVRGTGISGLHGILPKQGKIIRPILAFSKEEITASAKKQKLAFREDSSNASDKYLRNKIRQKLIPLLKEMNPSIQQTILEEMQRLQEVEKIYREAIDKKKQQIVKKDGNNYRISIEELKTSEAGAVYLFEFLYPFGFKPAAITEIIHSLDGLPGKQFLSDTHRLIRDRRHLILTPKNTNTGSSYYIKKDQKELQLENCSFKFRLIAAGKTLNKKNSIANLDLDKLEFPLELRKWKKGDSFQPFGMKGKKKLSDFFTDNKLSLDRKENTWLLCSGGKIAWVAGMRIDERFRVNPGTKKIFAAELV